MLALKRDVLLISALQLPLAVKTAFRQVAGKLNYPHIGIYLIYRGAVLGSNGFKSPLTTASLINRDTWPDDVTFSPYRFLSEVLNSFKLL